MYFLISVYGWVLFVVFLLLFFLYFLHNVCIGCPAPSSTVNLLIKRGVYGIFCLEKMGQCITVGWNAPTKTLQCA